MHQQESTASSTSSVYGTLPSSPVPTTATDPAAPVFKRAEDTVMERIRKLGSLNDILPFMALTKLPINHIYTVTKVIKRVKGEDGAPFSGIQLVLDDEIRTALPRKYFSNFFQKC